MNCHTPKWTPILGVGIPMNSRIFRVWLQRSKPIGLKSFLYHWKKVLKRRCLKWAHMTHLDIWNISYGQKKGRESNCQFDFRPLKIGNWFDFLACRWCETYCWTTLDVTLDFISIRGLHTKLWGPKLAGVLTLGLPFGSLGTKCHLDVGVVERHKVYYKGEGGGFPKVWAVVSLMNLSLLVAHPSTKSVLAMH